MISTENLQTLTIWLVGSVNCLQKYLYCSRHNNYDLRKFLLPWISFVDATISGRNWLYFDIESCTYIFFSRCLQTVLPHIHLLWELVLTNEVLIVQMWKKNIVIIHCFMYTVDTRVVIRVFVTMHVCKKKMLIILRKPFLHLKLEYMVIWAMWRCTGSHLQYLPSPVILRP